MFFAKTQINLGGSLTLPHVIFSSLYDWINGPTKTSVV